MDEKVVNNFIKQAQEAMENSKAIFLCPSCAHKDVCKKADEPARECNDFMSATGYQQYGSINHFFQPIFDWIQYHYPAGEVKFIVDYNSAKMMIEHGPFVVDKSIMGCLPPKKKIGRMNKKNPETIEWCKHH